MESIRRQSQHAMCGQKELTRKAIVMLLRQIIVDEDGNSTIIILEPFLQVLHLAIWYLQAWPSIPLKGGCLG